jgi:ankyrin repeat protein
MAGAAAAPPELSRKSIHAYLSGGHDVNDPVVNVLFDLTMYPFYFPMTLAQLCIQARNLSSFKMVLENGSRLNGLLAAAIQLHSHFCFDHLLTTSADVNEMDPAYHLTPLQIAVRSHQVYFVNALLDHGADATIPDGVPFLFMKIALQFLSQQPWNSMTLSKPFSSTIAQLDRQPHNSVH